MKYLYSILASLFIGLHLFCIKLMSTYKTYFYEILLLSTLALIISKYYTYYAMIKFENPTDVHNILNFSVFITLFLSVYFLNITPINIYKYIVGLIFIIIGLYFIQTSNMTNK
jgi:drug/metabolite transporter (DMT)-like permease